MVLLPQEDGLIKAGECLIDALELESELMSLCSAGNEPAIIPIPTSKVDQSTTCPMLSSLISTVKHE
jgi:hypothetical protein